MANELDIFIICDADRNVCSFQSVIVMGKSVTVPGIFAKEEDALEVLYVLDSLGIRKENHIERISAHLMPVDEDAQLQGQPS